MERVTAVFQSEAQAEQAVSDLRVMGVTDAHLSFVSRHGEADDADHGKSKATEVAEGAGTGLLAGAGVGALFGLAAAAIPGVGPFITAGWLATALGTTAGGAAAGAIVGGTSGVVAGALANAGYSRDEAEYYGKAIEQGHILVAVDTRSDYDASRVEATLARHGGNIYAA